MWVLLIRQLTCTKINFQFRGVTKINFQFRTRVRIPSCPFVFFFSFFFFSVWVRIPLSSRCHVGRRESREQRRARASCVVRARAVSAVAWPSFGSVPIIRARFENLLYAQHISSAPACTKKNVSETLLADSVFYSTTRTCQTWSP